jgi:hypothetical protein
MKLLAGFIAVISGFTSGEIHEGKDYGLVEDSCEEYFHKAKSWPLTGSSSVLTPVILILSLQINILVLSDSARTLLASLTSSRLCTTSRQEFPSILLIPETVHLTKLTTIGQIHEKDGLVLLNRYVSMETLTLRNRTLRGSIMFTTATGNFAESIRL